MRISAWFVCGLLLPLGVQAETVAGETPAAQLKTVSAVFKNGLAFIVRQGEARLDSGGGIISPIRP